MTVGSWSKGMVDIPLPSLPKSSGYLVRIGVWNPERPAQKVFFGGPNTLLIRYLEGFSATFLNEAFEHRWMFLFLKGP